MQYANMTIASERWGTFTIDFPLLNAGHMAVSCDEKWKSGQKGSFNDRKSCPQPPLSRDQKVQLDVIGDCSGQLRTTRRYRMPGEAVGAKINPTVWRHQLKSVMAAIFSFFSSSPRGPRLDVSPEIN